MILPGFAITQFPRVPCECSAAAWHFHVQSDTVSQNSSWHCERKTPISSVHCKPLLRDYKRTHLTLTWCEALMCFPKASMLVLEAKCLVSIQFLSVDAKCASPWKRQYLFCHCTLCFTCYIVCFLLFWVCLECLVMHPILSKSLKLHRHPKFLTEHLATRRDAADPSTLWSMLKAALVERRTSLFRRLTLSPCWCSTTSSFLRKDGQCMTHLPRMAVIIHLMGSCFSATYTMRAWWNPSPQDGHGYILRCLGLWV